MRFASLFAGLIGIQFTATADNLAARAFFEQHCTECHDADSKKGGLDLTALPGTFTASADFARAAATSS
ncbi:MAG: c-type cytochrome domain-containing protein [Verrucomicrobiia bacterium]